MRISGLTVAELIHALEAFADPSATVLLCVDGEELAIRAVLVGEEAVAVCEAANDRGRVIVVVQELQS